MNLVDDGANVARDEENTLDTPAPFFARLWKGPLRVGLEPDTYLEDSMSGFEDVVRIVQQEDCSEDCTLSLTEITVRFECDGRDCSLEPLPDRKSLKAARLTSSGVHARAQGSAALEAAERAWRDRFGTTFVEDLRAALVGRVQRVDVELPHFPTGYGQGDSSMTGGAFVPGESGPPRIPPHGEEWPVVLREDREAVWRDYPLSDDALAALRADDVAALAPRVNPYLLRFYFAATGMPDANFIAKLREGAHG